jgi:oligopeptide transport system substrate-binding protein
MIFKNLAHLRLLLALSLVVLLSSCHKEKESKGYLKINIKEEPISLDPRKGGDVVSSTFHFMLFEGLTRLNTEGSIIPAQAERIVISEDGTIYTFSLRKSHWSDGSLVTAYDFEKAWKDILSPSFPSVNAHLLYPIKNAEEVKQGKLPLSAVGIYALNAKTLVVELKAPTPYFLDLTGFSVFFPVKSDIDKKDPEWAYHVSPRFLCNGPFTLKEWKHEGQIVVEKNELYWEKERIHLEGIHISMVANEMTALQMYENKELDLLDMWISPIPLEALAELSKRENLNVKPIGGSTVCVFNVKSPFFQNIHLRKAFALAIDRGAIVKNITGLGELPALQLIPPVLKNAETKPFFKDHDREAARFFLKKGLSELGLQLKDLQGITYIYSASERNHKIAQALQQQWLDVLNVEVHLQNLEAKLHLDSLARRTFHFGQSQWFAQYHDQLNFFERFKSRANVKNYPGWENETFVSLLNRASLERDPQRRLKILESAEALFIEEMPLTPIYHWSTALLAQPYVKNLRVFKMGNPDFTQISLDERARALSQR